MTDLRSSITTEPEHAGALWEIVRLKSRLQWNAERAHEISEKYDLDETIVRRYSAIANRLIQESVQMNADEARAIMLVSIQAALDEAKKDRAHNAVAMNHATVARLLGLNAPEKIEVRAEYQTLSEEELERREQEAVAQLAALREGAARRDGGR